MSPIGRAALRISTFAALLAVSACNETVAPAFANIEFDVAGSSFEPGGLVPATLTNRSLEAISYNFCFTDADRRDGSAWIEVPDPRVCAAVGYGLTVGQSASFEHRLPASLPAGTYRLRIGLHAMFGPWQGDVVTDPFEVAP